MNRAKTLLIDILEELNANRGNAYDDFKPYNSIHATSNTSGFYLTIKYVKEKLQVDEKNKGSMEKSRIYCIART